MFPMHTGKSLFNVKHLMVLVLLVLVLSASLVLTTGVVSAHTASPALATTGSSSWVYHA